MLSQNTKQPSPLMPASKSEFRPRSPVVVVMGHVNHGKTSLLDYLRKTNTVEKEAGGITQSMGAYEVDLTRTEPDKNTDRTGHNAAKKITFIDTPGHEAFSRMRTRGASIADLAILVVASDEGPKPQTKEAVKTLKDTNTPYIVALTKVDKPNADIEKTINALLAEEVMLEGRGGDISWQGVSVKTGEGVTELLNLILLLAEVEGLNYNSRSPGRGFIIESLKDNRRGLVVNFILKNGTLREGDEVATESAKGKIKILENFLGERVDELTPSAPGTIVGFEELPKVGEEFFVGGEKTVKKSLIGAAIAGKADRNKLGVALKADTSGSLEVLKQVIEPLGVEITDSSVGDVNTNDINGAKNTGSLILAFGAKTDRANQNLAQIHRVTIISSGVIYELVKAVEEHLKNSRVGGPAGELAVLKIFSKNGKGYIVGGKVVSGVIYATAPAKIFRNGEEIGVGTIKNLQSGKKDVDEVQSGECGILLQTDKQVMAGDIIRTYD